MQGDKLTGKYQLMSVAYRISSNTPAGKASLSFIFDYIRELKEIRTLINDQLPRNPSDGNDIMSD